MVNWLDPATVFAEEVTLVKLVHVVGGIYIWEIVSCLDFEYSVISKKRKFTWSFLLYLGCRWFPLFAVALQFLGFDVSHKINCQTCAVLSFMFAYLSFMCTSALIILRVKIIIALTCAVWIGNTASYAYSLTTLRTAWTGSLCAIFHTADGRTSVISTFTTDLILLVLMLTGLKRWKNAPKSCGVWRLLCTQGLVFILLNLNVELPDPMNLMFQALALIITPLGAARLYRESHRLPLLQWFGQEDGSVVLEVKTPDSEVPKGETFEGGNIV
ncbi:hypothetical protein EDB83DRAFT_2524741 [Lactarius deliciosus]|nr:hypothetical protein EDB83DRAFT_2524741 [Lactarius deliciosus]